MIDEEILEALRDVDRRFAADESLPRDLLTGYEAISADTDLGPLWLDAEEQLIRPYILSHGRWDPALSNFLRRTLRPGMCVLDVGANIGYLTIAAERRAALRDGERTRDRGGAGAVQRLAPARHRLSQQAQGCRRAAGRSAPP